MSARKIGLESTRSCLLFWMSAICIFIALAAPAVAEEGRCDAALHTSDPILDELCGSLTALIAASPPPDGASYLTLKRHAEGIAGELKELLVSEGYYTAVVKVGQIAATDGSDSSFKVSLGSRFRVTAYEAAFEADVAKPPGPTEIDLEWTHSPRGEDIATVQSAYVTYLRDHGFPFAKVKDRVIHIREQEATATVVWQIDQGAKCIFGPVEITGLRRVQESYIRRMIHIPEGDECSQSILSKEKSSLAKSGLFSLVKVDILEDRRSGEVMPIRLNLTERRHRTVGAGISYETNVGFGGKATWEHRNLLGRGERLRSQLKIGEISQSASLEFKKTYPKRKTTLFGDISILHETKDAYDASQAGIGVGYERPFLSDWRLTYAINADYTEVESQGVLEKGLELSLPMKFQRKKIDNSLDPRDGYRLTFELEPVTSAVGDGATFLRSDARSAAYFPLPAGKSSSVAVWVHLGGTFGVSLDDLPATRRYFGGGAQSVRAIEYEQLGSIGPTEAPIGGRSIFETGVEARTRITENWGGVAFVEGGRNFASAYPDFSEDLLWGGGVGLRYQTAIGPLRIDVATPFNPRDFDDPVQFYIGLGHAF